MQKNSSDQVQELTDVVQGMSVHIVITRATSPCTLEFKHAGDDWQPHPHFDGTPTDGVIIEEIRCPSATMRLSFTDAPGNAYFLSVDEITQGNW